MADNDSVPVASGNSTFANNDIGGVKYPRVKVTWGPAGTANDADVATGKPLPVQLRSSTGVALTGAAGAGSAAVVTVQGDAAGTAVPVSGTFWQATQPVSGTFYQATQPVSLASVPSHAVTNAGTFAVQAAVTAAASSIAAGAIAAGATSFVALEDTASADADAGVKTLAVRKVTPANTSGTDGDYEFLQMYLGRLWTNTLIGDGTNNVAIKGASTPPVAADNAVVVAISPNSVNSNGRKTDLLSAPVVLASQTYETIAASQTAQVMGGSGASGDFISHILVVPANLNPGNILLLDNAISITVFAGGTGSVTTLHPFTIAISAVSASGAWKITTGASVSCMAVGNFT